MLRYCNWPISAVLLVLPVAVNELFGWLMSVVSPIWWYTERKVLEYTILFAIKQLITSQVKSQFEPSPYPLQNLCTYIISFINRKGHLTFSGWAIIHMNVSDIVCWLTSSACNGKYIRACRISSSHTFTHQTSISMQATGTPNCHFTPSHTRVHLATFHFVQWELYLCVTHD